eukprot:jgi/Chlat1/5660/Chrsp37S09011
MRDTMHISTNMGCATHVAVGFDAGQRNRISLTTAMRLVLLFLSIAAPLCFFPAVHAQPVAIQANFRLERVLAGGGGFTQPTCARFAPDGRVFVAEKAGKIKVFNSLEDANPQVLLDISGRVHNYGDRGLLSLALDPTDFTPSTGHPTTTTIHLYAFYAYDPNDSFHDSCPSLDTPCKAFGRVSRWRIDGTNAVVGSEEVLLSSQFCYAFYSHSTGDLAFDSDGYLWVSSGEGAFPEGVDTGGPRSGSCAGDPVNEGGALRSQDLLTPTSDPLGYNGAILRLDVSKSGTPSGVSGTYAGKHWGVQASRIAAFGARNPFRITVRPRAPRNNAELWFGDVGWARFEEINRVKDTSVQTQNFGWPCYEGGINRQSSIQPNYQAANVPLCKKLYTNTATVGTLTAPYFAYTRFNSPVNPRSNREGGCSNPFAGQASISGLAFYDRTVDSSNWPSQYDGALIFGDASYHCVWAMLPGADGLPDPTKVVTLIDKLRAVDVQRGPSGDMYVTDIDAGSVYRLRYGGALASISATPSQGVSPLSVTLSSVGSQGVGALSYALDVNNDGSVESRAASFKYTFHTRPGQTASIYNIKLTVRDAAGNSHSAVTTVAVVSDASQLPKATITQPVPTFKWTTGLPVPFAGSGNKPTDRLAWNVLLYHCDPANAKACHIHYWQSIGNVKSGTFIAPDHQYPSHLGVKLTVTAANGLIAAQEVRVDPATYSLSLSTQPSSVGIPLGLNDFTGVTPYAQTIIKGSQSTVSASAYAFLYDINAFLVRGTTWKMLSGADVGSASAATVTWPSAYSPTRTTYAEVQLLRTNTPVPTASQCALVVVAKSPSTGGGAKISALIDQGPPGYALIGESQRMDMSLTTNWKTFSSIFNTGNGYAASRFVLDLGTNKAGTTVHIWRADLVCISPTPPAPVPCGYNFALTGGYGWQLYANNPTASAVVTWPAKTGTPAVVAISAGGTAAWHIQVFQMNVPIPAQSRCTVTLSARASRTASALMVIDQGAPGYALVAGYNQHSFALTTTQKTFSASFDSGAGWPTARVLVELGGNAKGTDVYLYLVRLTCAPASRGKYKFSKWSDGGAASHVTKASVLTAYYNAV